MSSEVINAASVHQRYYHYAGTVLGDEESNSKYQTRREKTHPHLAI
jgi:hypothetical protein